MTVHHVESRPWFQADGEYGNLLVEARKETWLPVVRQSSAACSALIALMAAACPFESEIAPIRDQYMGEGLQWAFSMHRLIVLSTSIPDDK